MNSSHLLPDPTGGNEESIPASCCSLSSGLLSPEQAQNYASLFKVLSDPVRLRILSAIADACCTPMNVQQITKLVGLSQPTVSHHLKKLCESGMLNRRREGRTVFHRVNPQVFAELRTIIEIG